MKYDLSSKALKQKELDSFVLENLKSDINDERYWTYRLVAFLIEVSEFLNEVKFFKYWSKNKDNVNRERILEEYVDGLHFLFSLGNTIGFNKWIFGAGDIKEPLEMLLFSLNEDVLKLRRDKDLEVFNKLFVNYLKMAWSVGIKPEELDQAYDKKYQLNIERQKNNY